MKLWLNVGDAADHAGVCRDTIYTACERRELRHVRIGGRRTIRLKREWLDEWFERFAQGGARSTSGMAPTAGACGAAGRV